MEKPDPYVPDSEELNERPPIMGNWNRLYLLVLVIHALFIFLFYLFTHYYS
jgi:hypothetical protein